MKTYDRSGTKILTRASALSLLALGTISAATCMEHPNYHVRASGFKALGCPIPEPTETKVKNKETGEYESVLDHSARVNLFASVAPNLFARACRQKASDESKLKENRGLIAAAVKHNAEAEIENAAKADDPDFIPRELSEVPALFEPLPINEYATALASTNALGRVFLTLPGVVESLPQPS